MVNERNTQTLLGEEIAKRLDQLGYSRRTFCKTFGLSRQTLNALEHDNQKSFSPKTFDTLDEGLKWPKGTAEAFYRGIANAKDELGGWSAEERVDYYVKSIVTHVMSMNIDELEREVLMLEEEQYGRTLPTDEEALVVIRETVQRLGNAIVHRPTLRRVRDG